MIPSHARPGRLRGCLESLLSDPSDDFTIIVVDDGSPEPLGPMCDTFGTRVRCLQQPKRGPAAARNAGVAASDADFIAFTDDDCVPRRGWLDALRAAWIGDARRLVGGRVENALPKNPYASASQSLCDYLYRYFGAQDGDAPFFTSNNLACARARFDALGGFDDSFPLAAAEDRDLGLRWRAAGGALHYAPDAVVGHRHALGPLEFWHQHAGYGRGAHHLHRRMRDRGDELPKREPLRFYLGLLAEPLRAGGPARLPQSVLLALSQVAMITGYAHEKRAISDAEDPGEPVPQPPRVDAAVRTKPRTSARSG